MAVHTRNGWIGAVEALGIQASMNGCGQWMGNVFIERLCPGSCRDPIEPKAGMDERMRGHNHHRIHQALDHAKPW